MAQWIAIALTIIGLLAGFWKVSTAAAARDARLCERLDFMKGEIIQLQNASQTPGERENFERLLDARFKAHEDLDEERFENISKLLDDKLTQIVSAVNRLGPNHNKR